MKTNQKIKGALIGTLLAAALTVPMVASAIQFQVKMTGTGSYAGAYDSGVQNTNAIAGLLSGSGGDFAFDLSSNNSPGSSAIGSYIDSVWNANSSGGTGTVTVWASATDYTTPGAGIYNLFSSIGGTNLNSNIAVTSADAWTDNSNALFGTSGASTSQGPFSSAGAFAEDVASAPFLGATPFSMTQKLVFNITGAGISTGDFLTKVPAPGPLALIGLGLLAAGALRLRKAQG